jgi:hypothetical protein
MPRLLASAADLTPVRLTKILTAQRALAGGKVAAVTVTDEAQTPWSTVYHLEVSYSPDAAGDAPARLFLKTGQGGEAEVRFYGTLARSAGLTLPVVPCYDAAWSPTAERSHLLLLDLAATHGLIAPWPMPPLQAQGEAFSRQLAKLHARWWGHPDLGKTIGNMQWNLRSERAYRETTAWRRAAFGRFAVFLGDRLDVEQRDLYEQVLAFLPALSERYWRHRLRSRRGLTLIHGDCHPGNLLYPKDTRRGDIYLVDWQGYRVATGATDLAYMVSCHWYAERERALPFLECYHAGLVENGIEDYGWDDFCLDYAVAITEYLFDPVRLYDASVDPSVWWPILQKVLVAYRQFQPWLAALTPARG